MQNALFDILTNEYADGTLVDQVPTDNTLYYSIQSHLTRLLNARQGSLPHLPDYGLPDVEELYRGLPYSVTDLIEFIRKTIEKYEPRLQQVRVMHKAEDNRDCVLCLEITGTTASGKAQFETYFLSGGVAQIQRI